MPLSGSKGARKHLGDLLMQARVDLDVRYKNRALFARERGLNYRLVQDIENAARDNFDPPTKLAIERAYGWAYGSINAVLAGGLPSLAAPSSGYDPATEQKLILGAQELDQERERRRRAQQEAERRDENDDDDEGHAANGTNG